jgi:transcriptional regulator with XRE-family HTH domain
MIRRTRVSRGLSSKDLASLAGVSPSTVRAHEGAGARSAIPKLSVAADVAAALGVKPSRLTTGIIYIPTREPSWHDATGVVRWGPGREGAFVRRTTRGSDEAKGPANSARSASDVRIVAGALDDLRVPYPTTLFADARWAVFRRPRRAFQSGFRQIALKYGRRLFGLVSNLFVPHREFA